MKIISSERRGARYDEAYAISLIETL